MEEKVLLLGNMSLTFEGNNSIDAEVLMQSLSGAIKAYKATLSAAYDGQDAEIRLNIKAFAPGSVEVLLESVVSTIPMIAPYMPDIIESTKTFLEIVKLKKELRGKKPTSVEHEGNHTRITNNEGETYYHDSTVYNIYLNHPSIDAGLSSLFNALNGSERPAISFTASNQQVQIEEPEYDNMGVSLVDELREAEYQKIESIIEDQLLLKSPDLLGNAKWSFYYDGKVIHAGIEDEAFMNSLRKGEIKLFAGIRFPVRMKIEAFFNQKLEPEKKIYSILEITGDLIEPSSESGQLVLDEFKD